MGKNNVVGEDRILAEDVRGNLARGGKRGCKL